MTPAVFLVILCLGVVPGASALDLSLDVQWQEWKIKYEKLYSPEEEVLKRVVWEENVKKIELHNRENSLGKNTYTMEINDFADMTDEEFKDMIIGFQLPVHNTEKRLWKRALGSFFPNSWNWRDALPKFVDWRNEGYVTRVRKQGGCSSCWAFPVTGAIEGQMFKKTGKLIPLSVQNLIDCSKPQGNRGCLWGNTYNAFQYVLHNGGLEAEATYPYERKEGVCRYNPKNSSAKITGFVVLPESEDVLMDAVATKGPIATGVHVISSSFRFYQKGVYHEPKCSSYVNHAVLVVGYGFEGNETDGNNYWLIKNSWGKRWGLRGYMKIAKDRNNHCAIASLAQYPTV
ncbi:rCG24173 [Rattus norvegicus]|uniref:Cathepsin Q n=2 Tax=Rattus norvegicus TaxID=10116 RepID=CATQ_RAT|nr:cathepsin Q precursor [Rattus norvegicus]Q9QZE3.1 RecName: Full=Cathepsin Q; Flags: Precursor [Rattus norvegicus]AAF01247.1 cathepsin Q [Rattus norvegicus]EDL93849.1 rCG24173 [Rattus norvegicus]|eukprot:NP_640355.1 cathepsin Q precursor [Rattus norvegicus]